MDRSSCRLYMAWPSSVQGAGHRCARPVGWQGKRGLDVPTAGTEELGRCSQAATWREI